MRRHASSAIRSSIRSAGVGSARISPRTRFAAAIVRVIHQLPHAVSDRCRCDATLGQGNSCTAERQSVGILELVGSHRHHQLRHALGGEQRAAARVVHGEVDLSQHQILTNEPLHPRHEVRASQNDHLVTGRQQYIGEAQQG
jgi:hypothetical protein